MSNCVIDTKSNIEIQRLYEFINRHNRLVILSGAGISAGSGIPTYRNRDGIWLTSKPITHQEFVSQSLKRKRYWIRSLHGWPSLRDAIPNEGHHAIAGLEKRGKISLLITQNVDRLHQRANSQRVLDLHGRIDKAICLQCSHTLERQDIQDWLIENNPELVIYSTETRPDGDASLETKIDYSKFKTPDCDRCGGILKPDVVFFGGAIPKDRYELGRKAITSSDALLVTGSSLNVYSGYSFCRFANENGKPIAVVNQGVTRADNMADLKIDQACEIVLNRLVSSFDFDQID